MSVYKVYNISVSGTPDNPQRIYYNQLAGADGQLPATLTNPPVIVIQSQKSDVKVYLTSDTTETYFEIAKSFFGAEVDSVVCNLLIFPDITYSRVTGLTVTGTYENPQTVNFADLTDESGDSLSTFSSAPSVILQSISRDLNVFIRSVSTTGFTIAKSDQLGALGTVTVSVAVIDGAPAIATTNVSYKVSNITVTGTPDSPQTVTFSDLTSDAGSSLSTFATAPVVILECINADRNVYITGIPGTSSFSIAKSNIGASVTITCNIIIVGVQSLHPVMLLPEMISLLNIYLEDPEKRHFVGAIKVKLLNQAQNKILNETPLHLFRNLHVTLTDQSLDSDSEFDLTGLSQPIYRYEFGLLRINITGEKPARKISEEEYIRLLRLSRTFTTEKSYYFMNGTKIHILPEDEDSIDFKYMRVPAKMSLGTTTEQDVNCELDYSFHDIVVGLACEKFQHVCESARMAYESALVELEQLKKKSPPTDSIIENTDLRLSDEYNIEEEYNIKFEYE